MKRFKDVVLTHASKGGIRGAISPCLRTILDCIPLMRTWRLRLSTRISSCQPIGVIHDGI